MNQATRYKAPPLDFSSPEPVELREADLDLSSVLRLIRRRIRFIGVVAAALTLLILPLIMMLQPVYRGEARFLIQPPLVADPAAAKPGFNLDDEVQRVTSRAIADHIVQQFDLTSRPEFNPNLKPASILSKLVGAARVRLLGQSASPAPRPDPAEAVLAAFYDRLVVQRQTDSIMQISFRSTDPQLAADVPNAMVEAYLADRRAFHDARIAQAMDQVDARLAAQQARADAATAAVNAFQNQNGVTSAGHVVDIQTNQLVLLNAQRADLQKRRIELQSKIASVEAALAGDGPAPLEEPDSLIQLRQSLQQEKNELTRLSSRFGDGFAGVQTQRARIAGLETAIRAELTAWGQSLKAQLVQLGDEEAQAAASDVAAQGALSRTSIAEMQLTDLVRRASVQTQILEAIQAEKSQLEGLRTQPVFDLEMLSPATVPIWPEGRSRKVYLMLAAFAAVVVAVTAAGLLELTDRTLRSPQQLQGEPGLVAIGLLPVPARRGHSDGGLDAAPDARLAEALRGVILAMENDNGGVLPASLMITTARPDEGADRVAYGLAHAMADSGHNVLIVDALTPNSQFRLGRKRNVEPGLAEYLRHEHPLAKLATHSKIPGVEVLHHGNGPLAPLVDTTAIEAILDLAAAFGQIVIFVCPPVLNNTSALRIASAVRRVLLVIDWGATPRESVLLSAQRLRVARIDRILTLLNRVQPKQHALYPYRDAAAFADPGSAPGW